MVTFGFVLLPPLLAYPFARTMGQLAWLSSLVGGSMAIVGFAVADRQSLPVGPTDVGLLGALYGFSWTVQRLVVWVVTKRQNATTG